LEGVETEQLPLHITVPPQFPQEAPKLAGVETEHIPLHWMVPPQLPQVLP
jgi:hypothetical protein